MVRAWFVEWPGFDVYLVKGKLGVCLINIGEAQIKTVCLDLGHCELETCLLLATYRFKKAHVFGALSVQSDGVDSKILAAYRRIALQAGKTQVSDARMNTL